MIRVEIKGDVATIYGPFGMEFLRLVSRLSGRKAWHGSKSVNIEASGSNLKVLRESGFELEWDDKSGLLRELRELEMMSSQHDLAKEIGTPYTPQVPYLKHMEHCLGISWMRKAYGLLLEMGLCKTSICIHNFGILYKKGEITGVLIFAPKGVHRQWVRDQIPEHLDASIKVHMTLWDSKEEYTNRDFIQPGKLVVFAMNTDSIRTEAGQTAAALFIRAHAGKVFMAVDESHDIKNYGSTRTQEMLKIGRHCAYRRILTGTPIAKSLEDMWSQFMFLDPKIIGINHLAVFKSRFSELGGFANKQTVGSKNIEEFYSIIAPHCYRLTKAEATDLPPKMYIKREYEMDKNTLKHYENLKHSYMTQLENRTIDAKNWLDCVIKMQQLLSGYITLDSKTHTIERISEQRAEIVVEMLKQINGQVIVWCIFIPDITILREIIREKLKEDVCLIGDIEDYQKRRKRISLLNPASGGTGLNLQFKTPGDNNAIYYNNTNRSIPRWQSEDRIWRQGMGGNAQIFDIIAHKSCDMGILNTLQDKRDLASLALDDIRRLIAGS